jgi:hypothetical protein
MQSAVYDFFMPFVDIVRVIVFFPVAMTDAEGFS